MIESVPTDGASGVDRFRESLERLPDWRSLEVFGPPGAGKSHLVRQVSARLDVLTMCDRQAVRFYAALDLPRTTRIAGSLLGEKRLRNYYGAWMRPYYRNYWKRAGPELRAYLSVVERVRDSFPLPAEATKRFNNRVRGSGAFLARALSDQRRMIVDEGLLNQLNSVIARSAGDRIDDERRGVVRECLAAYPWEKTAVIVDAPAEVCIQRQQSRKQILFTADRPQEVFHQVAHMIEALCQETGWRTQRIRNG